MSDYKYSFTLAAELLDMPLTLASSSAEASRIPFSEPKCLRSARLRPGPMPGTESSSEVKASLPLTFLWYVIAKR